MKITDIVSQKKDPKRVSIFIDGEFAFGISLDLRFDKKLEVGKNISDKQIESLIEDDQVERLLNKSLRFLSYRPRTEKEIRDHLLRRGKLKDVEKSAPEKALYEKSIEEVLGKLKRLGQINDEEFAKWLVEQRRRFKQRGSRLIKSELVQKGVGRDVIERVTELEKESNGIDEELAKKAGEKKLIAYKKLDKQEFRNKMGQYLARRGFGWDVIKKVVDSLGQKR